MSLKVVDLNVQISGKAGKAQIISPILQGEKLSLREVKVAFPNQMNHSGRVRVKGLLVPGFSF